MDLQQHSIRISRQKPQVDKLAEGLYLPVHMCDQVKAHGTRWLLLGAGGKFSRCDGLDLCPELLDAHLCLRLLSLFIPEVW